MAQPVTVPTTPAIDNNNIPAKVGSDRFATPGYTPALDSTKPLEPTPLTQQDLQREYVAGAPAGDSSYLLGTNFLRTLPQYIDDLEQSFNDSVYDAMLKDPVAISSVNTLKLSVLANGLTSKPATEDEADPDFDLAQELAEFCDYNMNRLPQPLVSILDNLLDAIAYGNKVAEKVYEVEAQGKFSGKWVLKDLKSKPRRATAFVVDVYLNIVGIMGIAPNSYGNGLATILLTGLIGTPLLNGSTGNQVPELPPNVFPREKFLVFTYKPKDSDPRGHSILRAAYAAWWFKVSLMPDYAAYTGQYASPMLLGFTKEGAQALPLLDSLGNVVPGTALTPETVMGSVLAQARNSTYMVFPGGSQVTPLQVAGNGEAFTTALAWADEQVQIAIEHQTLGGGSSAKFQTNASSSVHADTRDLVVANIQDALAQTITHDIFYWLVKYNYGDDAANRLCPKASFAAGPASDFATDVTAIASLMTSGYLDHSQLPGLDDRLGLPERSQQSVEQAAAMADLGMQGAKAAAEQAANPQQPDQQNQQDNQQGGNSNSDKPFGKKAVA